jgi:formylglycine-generating enzyme required for sulfatase activity
VNNGAGPFAESDPASVSGFRLDKYEVTVGRFRQFVSAWDGGSGFLPAAGSGKHAHLNGGQGLVNAGAVGADGGVAYETGWLASDDANVRPTTPNLTTACFVPGATWTAAGGSQERLPINCVTREEAIAFCIWDGGFLPSEAEWEYAAAGGSQLLEHPWGTTDPSTSDHYAIYGCNYPGGVPDASASCTSVANIAPVGFASAGAGLWGQLDLEGNLWEWNQDFYATYVDPCADCAYLTDTSLDVFRGGSFQIDPAWLPPRRNDVPSGNRYYTAGFRCARTP